MPMSSHYPGVLQYYTTVIPLGHQHIHWVVTSPPRPRTGGQSKIDLRFKTRARFGFGVSYPTRRGNGDGDQWELLGVRRGGGVPLVYTILRLKQIEAPITRQRMYSQSEYSLQLGIYTANQNTAYTYYNREYIQPIRNQVTTGKYTSIYSQWQHYV